LLEFKCSELFRLL